MKSITSHLDQCDSHAQPSPCTLTLVDPSQLLHIFGEIFQRPNQILPLSALRLVDAPKHAQERARCPVRGLPCPPQPFWLSALPVPVTLYQLVHSTPSCLWGGKLSQPGPGKEQRLRARAGSLASRCFSFLICKMGIRISPIQRMETVQERSLVKHVGPWTCVSRQEGSGLLAFWSVWLTAVSMVSSTELVPEVI